MFQLIADSGSSKTDWRLLMEDQLISTVKTEGCNPYFTSKEIMMEMLAKKLLPKLKSKKIDQIHFYGAGCKAIEKKNQVKSALKGLFEITDINVETDMLGAARALLGDQEGFAAILGTGANSCIYDGKEIIRSMDSMGYILGDEGSGAHIGKLILKEWLRDGFSPKLEVKFFKFCQLDRDAIISRVYNEPHPNRFLAGFAKFAKENIAFEKIKAVVYDAFTDFIMEVQNRYDLPHEYPMNFTGSVAYNFSDYLEEAVDEWGQTMGRIIQAPINDLVKYHQIHS